MVNLGLHRRSIRGNPPDQPVAKKAADETVSPVGKAIYAGEEIVAGEKTGALEHIGAGENLTGIEQRNVRG